MSRGKYPWLVTFESAHGTTTWEVRGDTREEVEERAREALVFRGIDAKVVRVEPDR